MTDRHTADSINDNDLDTLYYRLTQARDAVALHRQGLITTAELYATVEAKPSTATPADTTLTRIRAYAQHAIDTGDTGPGPEIGRLLLHLLGEQPAPAAAEATELRTALTEALAHLYAITRVGDPTPIGWQTLNPIRPAVYDRWQAALDGQEQP